MIMNEVIVGLSIIVRGTKLSGITSSYQLLPVLTSTRVLVKLLGRVLDSKITR